LNNILGLFDEVKNVDVKTLQSFYL